MDLESSITAGSIVWVRRRNGSWWPGKVLGAEELPLSHITSPRSGTPVKLLGREDASVDWYNLEKSKRVKPFRCGEFDDCIDKAESSHGMPVKRREKYARREDAIIHALELEKELLRKQGKLVVKSDHTRNIRNELQANERAASFQKAKDDYHRLQLGREDDHFDYTPRMRGLQDLGLKTAYLKRKASSSDASDDSQRLRLNDNSHAPFDSVVLDVGRPIHENENGVEQVGGNRAKKIASVYLRAGSSDTSDGKVHPSQIEMSSSQMDDSDSQYEEENASESMEETESDFSRSESSESDSDSSKTELEMDEDMPHTAGAPRYPATRVSNTHGRFEALEHGNLSTEDSDESAFSGDLSYRHDQLLNHDTVSKWQLKGKRNTRNLTKRSSFSQRPLGHSFNSRRNDDYDEDERDFGARMVGSDNGRYMYASGKASRGQNHHFPNMMDLDDGDWDNRGHFGSRFVRHGHFGIRTRPVLLDVDLQVQPGVQKSRDPITSMRSKLDGKVIIGHSVKIGVLEDGSSENFCFADDFFGNDVVDHDVNTEVPPPWRTARRTNLRGLRLEVDDVDYNPFMDQERRSSFKRLDVGRYGQKSNLVGKSQIYSPRPPMDKRFSRKPRQRGNLLSNQKTRTLSSIGIEEKNHITKPLHKNRTGEIDGLIKPGLSGPTTVTCIPVKLVFSRLLEKINRPPSKAASKVVLPSSNMEKNLL
ncbi:hypothetical protein ACFE04_007005 [Oxalis oulophora]